MSRYGGTLSPPAAFVRWPEGGGAWFTAEKDGKPWCNHDANEWCSLAPDEHVRHPTYRVRPVENGDTDEP